MSTCLWLLYYLYSWLSSIITQKKVNSKGWSLSIHLLLPSYLTERARKRGKGKASRLFFLSSWKKPKREDTVAFWRRLPLIASHFAIFLIHLGSFVPPYNHPPQSWTQNALSIVFGIQHKPWSYFNFALSLFPWWFPSWIRSRFVADLNISKYWTLVLTLILNPNLTLPLTLLLSPNLTLTLALILGSYQNHVPTMARVYLCVPTR